MVCGPLDSIVAAVTGSKYLEAPVIEGLVGKEGNIIMRLYGNETTRTWTWMVINLEANQACIMSAGRDLRPVAGPRGQGL